MDPGGEPAPAPGHAGLTRAPPRAAVPRAFAATRCSRTACFAKNMVSGGWGGGTPPHGEWSLWEWTWGIGCRAGDWEGSR